MIRLRRILRYGISACGLLICLATAAMWARSRTVAIQNVLLARLNGRVWELSCRSRDHSGGVAFSTIGAFPHPAFAENIRFSDLGRFLTPNGREHMVDVGGRDFEFSHVGINYTSGFALPFFVEFEPIGTDGGVRQL